LCSHYIENDWHIFVGCEHAKKAWEEVSLWNKIQEVAVTGDDMKSLIFTSLKAFTTVQTDTFGFFGSDVTRNFRKIYRSPSTYH